MPKFSILLPTRNRLELLLQAIDTVIGQDFQDWEIVISDNCSDQMIKPEIDKINDNRIIYIRSTTFLPVTENWNKALRASSGEYVIMLGDDDGLLHGCLSKLNSSISSFNYPDAIYSSAALFAYPNVLKDAPDGFLRLYTERPLFKNKNEPYILNRESAKSYVRYSLNFRVFFDYNMQFFVISRKLIEDCTCNGDFFQSPYPDYYASNVIFHIARKLLIIPTPLVTIGISPKSFGYFYFNDSEAEGNSFLNNILSETDVHADIRRFLLPGTDMNTSWLLAMNALACNYNLTVNISRYRELQIRSVLSKYLSSTNPSKISIRKCRSKLTIFEYIWYILPFEVLNYVLPKSFSKQRAQDIILKGDSHPCSPMPEISTKFGNMLDVFNKFRPVE